MLHAPKDLSHDLRVQLTPQGPWGTIGKGYSTNNLVDYHTDYYYPQIFFIFSYVNHCSRPYKYEQGVGHMSQSLSPYNYYNHDESSIKVDFLTNRLLCSRSSDPYPVPNTTPQTFLNIGQQSSSSSNHGLLQGVFLRWFHLG